MSGFAEAVAALAEQAARLTQAAQTAARLSAEAMAEEAAASSPLREPLPVETEPTEDGALLRVRSPAAAALELGSLARAPRPFLRPAALREAERLPARVCEAWAGAPPGEP